MNKDNIIRMAREAGIDAWWESGDENRERLQDHLEHFAGLVATSERNRMCEKFNIPKELVYEKAKSNETSRAKVLGES